MPQHGRFTDRALLQIWDDPQTTEDDLARLTPGEQGRLEVLARGRDTEPSGPPGTLRQIGTGVVKGAGTTAVNLGELVTRIGRLVPGLQDIVGTPEEFAAARQILSPQSGLERAGFIGEQIGEVFAPGGAVTRGGQLLSRAALRGLGSRAGFLPRAAAATLPRMVTESAGAAGIAAAQGGDPQAAATWAAAIPGVTGLAGAAGSQVVPWLRRRAGEQVSRALGATKEEFKALATKHTPEILRRRLHGSLEGLQARAVRTSARAGEKIDELIEQIGDKPISGQPIIQALEEAKDAFRNVVMRKGKPVQIVLDPRPIGHLAELQRIVRAHGANLTVAHLRRIRQVWDDVVAQAGGFAQRAPGALGRPLADISEAQAKRTATTAIRQLLGVEHPDLARLNKEFNFWRDLERITRTTLERRKPQTRSLLANLATMAGAAGGATAAGPAAGMGERLGTAALVGATARGLTRLFQSSRWRLFDARQKDRLASAIASGAPERIEQAVGRILATQLTKPESP